MHSSPEPRPGSPPSIAHVIEHVAHLLPAQGPIGVFIHHNTLHAFEHEPFEEAVVDAGRRLGCEPFLPEDAYREAIRRGRILERDVDAVLAAALDGRAEEPVLAHVVRRDLWHRLLLHGIPEARGARLSWLIRETDVVAAGEAAALWRACTEAVARSRRAPRASAPPARHRDLLVACCDVDPDEWTRPVLIRFIGAYLDQGFAHWPMPARERGIYACFLDLYGRAPARWSAAWVGGLAELIADDRAARRSAEDSLVHSLDELGVLSGEWEEFLLEEALWLRGWAGMVRQLETRPDRAPHTPVPARLVEYLAVQLLLSRAALRHAVRSAGLPGRLSELRATLRDRLPAAEPTIDERAWPVFHAARLCDVPASRLAALSDADVTKLEAELADVDGVARRRLLHQAYERRLRQRFYDALVARAPRGPVEAPAFQAIFCLDDREESFRRHLEEVEPRAETFGAAGFYGVAMYYKGAHAAHPRPLCPIVVRPEHYVAEVERSSGSGARVRELRRALAASVDKNIHLGSGTFGRGAVIAALLGVLWMVPLVLRVLFPWSRRGMSRLQGALSERAGTRLQVERVDGTAPLGRSIGFSVDEMADIVRGQLAPLGVVDRLAPLVLVFGHGSTSLNNPYESAYDCGACGGGRGGPNARAFAQMANDPRVRSRLAEHGIRIPEGTWFVGGQRNSASNDVELYDEDRLPEPLRGLLHDARRALEIARRREAHERCRRFESAPPHWFPEAAALLHVQARASDMAQPRPECGHASNAVCLIGRRSRTRGLFLDRRAFLVSYDPERDPDGAVLAGLAAAVIPVCVGITLEYFFSYVDRTGYGAGTKLPHNVTGLLGVMDGAQSDLRTGLPWQMLEIHEPVRLTVAVEATPEALLRLVEKDAYLARLVHNRWLFLAALHPREPRLFEIDASGARPYRPEDPLAVVRGPSRAHYAGRRDHLAFAQLDPRPVEPT